METRKAGQKMSRRDFFKLGVASISVGALLFAAGCVPEQDDDDEDGGDEDDD